MNMEEAGKKGLSAGNLSREECAEGAGEITC
jgi:hypothetical protein